LGTDPSKTDDRRTPPIVTTVVLEILPVLRPELLMMINAAMLREVSSPPITTDFRFNVVDPPL